MFETGVRYQMYHALALFAVAWGHVALAGPMVLRHCGLAVRRGIVLFSGSLYLLALTGEAG